MATTNKQQREESKPVRLDGPLPLPNKKMKAFWSQRIDQTLAQIDALYDQLKEAIEQRDKL